MFTITIIFWGRWGCWVFPLFNYKGNGRHWKPQMMFAKLKMCFPVTQILGACLKLNVAKNSGNQTKISKSPLMLLQRQIASYAHLDQCLEKISDLKSFTSRHFQVPYMQRTFLWGKNSPLRSAGLGISEENCCTWVIFTSTEICNLKRKPKEHRNHDDHLKNAKPVPFVALFFRICSPKQTWIQ